MIVSAVEACDAWRAKYRRGLRQRLFPLRLHAVRVEVVSLPQRLLHRGVELLHNVGRQVRPAGGLRAATGRITRVACVDLIAAHQGAQVLLIGRGRLRLALDPGGQILHQLVVAPLVLQELCVGFAERILLVFAPRRSARPARRSSQA